MFFKKKSSFNKNTKTNVLGESLNNLMPNGELPFGWVAHNSDYFKTFESKIYTYADITKSDSLKNLIDYYCTFKQKCYSESDCHKKYFQDMYEHCSNSQNPDFEFVTLMEQKLLKLKS